MQAPLRGRRDVRVVAGFLKALQREPGLEALAAIAGDDQNALAHVASCRTPSFGMVADFLTSARCQIREPRVSRQRPGCPKWRAQSSGVPSCLLSRHPDIGAGREQPPDDLHVTPATPRGAAASPPRPNAPSDAFGSAPWPSSQIDGLADRFASPSGAARPRRVDQIRILAKQPLGGRRSRPAPAATRSSAPARAGRSPRAALMSSDAIIARIFSITAPIDIRRRRVHRGRLAGTVHRQRIGAELEQQRRPSPGRSSARRSAAASGDSRCGSCAC